MRRERGAISGRHVSRVEQGKDERLRIENIVKDSLVGMLPRHKEGIRCAVSRDIPDFSARVLVTRFNKSPDAAGHNLLHATARTSRPLSGFCRLTRTDSASDFPSDGTIALRKSFLSKSLEVQKVFCTAVRNFG